MMTTMMMCFRCLACVSSMWRCNWCPLDQLCTHNHSCPNQHIILNQRVRQPVCLSACLFVCLSGCLLILSLCLSAGVSWSHFLSAGLRPAEFYPCAVGPEHHCGAAGTKPGRLHCENNCCLYSSYQLFQCVKYGGSQGVSGGSPNPELCSSAPPGCVLCPSSETGFK